MKIEDTAQDLLAMEFSPPAGVAWCGIDLARIPRYGLISILETLDGERPADHHIFSRDHLIGRVRVSGQRQGVW